MTDFAFLRRFAGVAAPIFGVAFLFCSEPSGPESPSARLSAVIDRVKPNLEIVRGLKFTRPVYASSMTRDDYGRRYTGQPVSPAASQAMDLELYQMGLLSDTSVSFEQLQNDFQRGFPAAFYVAGTDSLYLISDQVITDPELEEVLSHEMTHALQDQALNAFSVGIDAMPPQSAYNSDFESAQRCLVEGDAMFTEIAYYYTHLSTVPGQDPFALAVVTTGYLRDTSIAQFASYEPDDYLMPIEYAPYYFGSYYVGGLHAQAFDWSSVNNRFALGNRPCCTADIISGVPITPHYFDLYPVYDMLIENRADLLFVDDDNYGAFTLMAAFREYGNAGRFVAADQGWRGDRLLYVRQNSWAWGRLVWALAFASSAEATIAFENLDRIIKRRFSYGPVADSASGNGVVRYYTGPSVNTVLARHDSQVWWLENLPAQQQKQVLDYLTATSTGTGLARRSAVAQGIPSSCMPTREQKERTKRVIQWDATRRAQAY